MNPPTPGHLFLIRKLIEEGIKKDVKKVYVILSKTNDNNENPISCQKKINVLGTHSDTSKTMINSIKEKMKSEEMNPLKKKKIQDIIVENRCVPEEKKYNLFSTIFSISYEYTGVNDLNLFLIIGDDRKNMLDSLSDFFLKHDRFNSVDGLILDRENMGEFKELSSNPETISKINMADVPISAISASFVRNLVKTFNKKKFIELYSPYLEKYKIDSLYDDITEGLKLKSAAKKNESTSTNLKYNYPLIKSRLPPNKKRKEESSDITLLNTKSKKIKTQTTQIKNIKSKDIKLKTQTKPKKGGKKNNKTKKLITIK